MLKELFPLLPAIRQSLIKIQTLHIFKGALKVQTLKDVVSSSRFACLLLIIHKVLCKDLLTLSTAQTNSLTLRQFQQAYNHRFNNYTCISCLRHDSPMLHDLAFTSLQFKSFICIPTASWKNSMEELLCMLSTFKNT